MEQPRRETFKYDISTEVTPKRHQNHLDAFLGTPLFCTLWAIVLGVICSSSQVWDVVDRVIYTKENTQMILNTADPLDVPEWNISRWEHATQEEVTTISPWRERRDNELIAAIWTLAVWLLADSSWWAVHINITPEDLCKDKNFQCSALAAFAFWQIESELRKSINK